MKRIFFVFLALTASWTLFGFTIEGITVTEGLLWTGSKPAEGKTELTPDPLVNNIGISVPMLITSYFLFDPELDFFLTKYVYLSSEQRPVPAADETANHVWTIGLIVDPAFVFQVKAGSIVHIRFILSPAFVFRIPTFAADNGAETRSQMTSYFYRNFRFFYPQTGMSVRVTLSERIALLVRGRVFFPLFHIWDQEEYGFADQFMASGSIGICFALGKDNGGE